LIEYLPSLLNQAMESFERVVRDLTIQPKEPKAP
jgi:hypothetical protein